MSKMLPYERYQLIIDQAKVQHFVSIRELKGLLNCSQTTIQRDIIYLESQGKIKRTMGGISYIDESIKYVEYSIYKNRQNLFRKEKEAIGKATQEYICDGEIIFISHGTTTYQVVNNIDTTKDVIIITNGLDIINCLEGKPNIKALILGGFIDYTHRQITGPVIPRMLEKLNISKLIIGVGGISEEKGVSFYDFVSVDYFSHIVPSVKQIIVVADHSKIGRDSLVQFIPLNQVNVIITDDGLDNKYIDIFKDHDIICKIAKVL